MGRAKAQTELMHDTTGPLDVASSNFDSEKACRSMRHYSPRHFHFVYVIDIYILQYHDDNSRHLPSYFRLLSYEFST